MRGLGRTAVAVACSALALAVAPPVAGAGVPAFCVPKKPARDFGFSQLPPVRSAPYDGDLPFAPPNVNVYGGSLLGEVAPQRTSSGFGFSEENERGTVHLGWTVTMQMWRLGGRGVPLREVDSETLFIGELDAADQPHISVDTLGGRGFYRADVQFTDEDGTQLGAYSSYVKVVRPFWKARLRLDRHAYRPGQKVLSRLENLGTRTMTYGEEFEVQRLADGRWVAAPDLTPNGWLLWLGVSGPGAYGLCNSVRLPQDVAPGRYRIVKPVEESVPHRRDRLRRLVAPFLVAAAT